MKSMNTQQHMSKLSNLQLLDMFRLTHERKCGFHYFYKVGNHAINKLTTSFLSSWKATKIKGNVISQSY